jgi:phage tail sheath protein FI
MAAASRYLHGIEVIEINNGTRPIQTVKSSIIGIVGTAPNADIDVFPTNEPVLLIGDQSKAALLGATGTLRQALADMYSIIGATVVVVRVEEGATDAQTLSNVIGDPVTKTGVWALLTANQKLSVKPRLLCAPGFTGSRPNNGIQSLTVNSGGQAYDPGRPPKLYMTGGGGGFGFDAVASILNGTVNAGVVTNPGHGYTSAPEVVAASATPVVTAVVGAANVGDGVLTIADPSYAPGIKPGAYTLTCTAAALNAGTFEVKDPDGTVLSPATVAVPYTGVVKFTIADGTNDFQVGDKFTLNVVFNPTFVRRFAEATNVGQGAMTLATPAWGPGVQLGDYTVTCKTASPGGGTFEVKDPGGTVLADATVGVAYTTQINFTIADGTPDFEVGDKFTVRVTSEGVGYGAALTAVPGLSANPVGKALEAAALRLRGIAFIDGPNTTDQDAVNFAKDYGSDRVIILDPYPLVWSSEINDYVARPGSPLAVALQAKVDNENGFWYPFSNVVLPMVGGMSRPITWEPDNPDTEANYLNENRVTTVVRMATTTSGGFRFSGVRSTASDPLWVFYNVRRTADMIYESIIDAFVWLLDKPISPALLEEAVRDVRAYLRLLAQRGATLGGDAWLDRHLNTKEELASGHLTISFDFEPPAPIERLTFNAQRNVAYYDVLLEEVIRELSVG